MFLSLVSFLRSILSIPVPVPNDPRKKSLRCQKGLKYFKTERPSIISSFFYPFRLLYSRR